jgi:hypothetical protein
MDSNCVKLLLAYCAISPRQVGSLLSLADGQQIDADALTGLCLQGLADRDNQLTGYGREVSERAAQIIEGRFVAPASGLTGIIQYQLQELDLGEAAWQDAQCAALGFGQAHVDALKELVLRPGQAFGSLHNRYGYDTWRHLVRAGFASAGQWRRHEPVHPTAKAEAFMAVLACKQFGALAGGTG